MKKYLNKEKFKFLVPLVFIGVTAFFSVLGAQTKLEYYREVFKKDFGFKIFESKEEEEEKIVEDFLSAGKDGDSGYFVLLSSPVPGLSPGLSPVILICDSPFSSDFPVKFSCDSNSVSSDDAFPVGGFLRIDSEQNIDWWVVPENLLLTPEKRSETKEFFKAVEKADKVLSDSAKGEEKEALDGSKSLLNSLKKLKESTVFEMFSISVSMLLVVVLMHRFLKLLSREDKKISFSDIKDFFNVNKNMPLYQRIIFFGTIWLIVVYFILMTSVSIKDVQKVDLGYILSYSIDSLNLKKVMTNASTGGYVRLIVFFYEAVVITLIFVLLLPPVVKVFKSAFFKISHAKIKPEFKKYSVPVLILISLLAVSFVDIQESYGFLILMMLVLSFVIFKNKGDLASVNYSNKEKIWYICAALLIMGTGFLLKIRESKVGVSYREEDLIGVADEAVVLPYSKQLGENSLINEYNFSGSWPIFADYYLVYSPNHSRVENKNAKDFKKEGSFYIQNGDIEDIISAVYSNGDLADELVSVTPTNFFRIRSLRNSYIENSVGVVSSTGRDEIINSENKEISEIRGNEKVNETTVKNGETAKPYFVKEPKIRITFSCKRQNLGINDVKADFYYLIEKDGKSDENEEKSNESKIETESETLFYFPGCSKTGIPQTYEVEFDTPYIDSDYLFVKLRDILPEDIESIKIINGYEIINPVYFVSKDGYGVLDSQEITTSPNTPIVNYIFGDSYDFSFDMVLNEEGKFDMSKPINELIKEGELKDRFLIWSTKKYLPVRLP